MSGIKRNPNVMWREEVDAMADAQAGLESGVDIEEVGTAVLFSGGAMLSLNLLGTEIWKLCDGRSSDDIVKVLLEHFEVQEETLKADVELFLSELLQKGFVSHEE